MVRIAYCLRLPATAHARRYIFEKEDLIMKKTVLFHRLLKI